ncbi:glycoside hydrolase family 3 protein [Petropleomorpha daqingensis]|uniref:beta-N-acetylhexosaminidase n=1 Tax=Petropleomorpha daqingensis TaxID=2026353 RepID=A0A853CNG5_9ACTN|nr:beta-N-acetylhexosaminidase [Petropleomorpha daqingensis]
MGSGRRTAGVLLVALALVSCSSGKDAASPSSSSPSSSSSAAPTSAAPANPDGLPPDQEQQVTAALAALDRRAQIAQLFVVGVPLSGLSAGDALVADGVGGVFLHGRSTASPGDIAAVTGRWTSAAPGGLRPWVAADQEGGQVQTLQGPGFGDLPSALVQGQLPPDQLAAVADGMGASLGQAGVTLDLAPVADIVPAGTAASNAPIGAFDRQYGSTAAEVVSAAGAVVRGLGAHDVTAALKHFPGLGSVRGNTDTTADVVDHTTPRDGSQVAAFGVLSRNAAHPFVMVSSATYQLIDPSSPAVFSPVVITDVLRGDIGFRGPVITDDVGTAKAVAAVPPGERAVRFLAAGGTLVLTVIAAPLQEMEDAVLARDAADPAFAKQVDAAVRTALVAKARAGLLPPA